MSLGKQTFNLSEKGMINERIKKWIHSYCSYKKYIFPDLSIKLSLKSKLKIKKLSTENDMYYWDNVNQNYRSYYFTLLELKKVYGTNNEIL